MAKVPHLDFLNLHVSPQFQFYMKQIVDALNNAGTVTHTAGALTLNNFVLGAGGGDIKDAGYAVVPLTAGGTGSATKNFVDLTTTQTVAGLKTFSNNTRTIGLGIGTDLAIASKQDIADAGPVWESYATIYDSLRVAVGGFPVNAEFGNNTVGIASAIVGALDTPANAAAGNAGFGIAGYGRTSSTTTGAVGVGGFGMAGADGVSIWGMNSVISNAATLQAATQTGKTDVTGYGWEINVNILKQPGGAAPNFALRGIYLIGGAEVQSSSSVVDAIGIDPIGYTAGIPWKNGFHTGDAATAVALNLGTLATGNNTGSQPIRLRSRTSGGTDHFTALVADADGNLSVARDDAAEIILQVPAIQSNLTGNVTGNASGSSGSCTGNAATATTANACSGNSATATTLQTGRSIGGSASFNGGADVDVKRLLSMAGTGGATTANLCYMYYNAGKIEFWVDTTKIWTTP